MRFLLLSAFLVSCATYKPFTPTTVQAPPDAFARATRVLIERGDTIETKDEAAGLIVTKWEESKSMGTFRRLRWSITIASGTATVVSQCQIRIESAMPGDAEWSDCGTSQPEDRTEKARRIASGIAAR